MRTSARAGQMEGLSSGHIITSSDEDSEGGREGERIQYEGMASAPPVQDPPKAGRPSNRRTFEPTSKSAEWLTRAACAPPVSPIASSPVLNAWQFRFAIRQIRCISSIEKACGRNFAACWLPENFAAIARVSITTRESEFKSG